jgi:hypothetical protein
MRAIILTACLAMPAAAQDSAFWATTGCQIVPITGEAWVAEIRCVNRLTTMTSPDVAADLHTGDLTVGLFVEQTFGRTPDSFMVTPPDGYVADPPVLVLDEDTAGVVRVMPWLGF